MCGQGQQIRDWLFVEDHARALYTVVTQGQIGESYNIGGHNEKRNIEVVRSICTLLDELRPREDGQSYATQITFVQDRPGHDMRYAIDAGKIGRELGWGLHAIVEISLEQQNTQWLDEFERAACACPEVQQCWRTSAGPDFVLVVYAHDMPAYLALAQRLFTSQANVRNVKAFFATRRAKFETKIPIALI